MPVVSPDRPHQHLGKSVHLQTHKSHQSNKHKPEVPLEYHSVQNYFTVNSQKYCQSFHTSKYNNNTYIKYHKLQNRGEWKASFIH